MVLLKHSHDGFQQINKKQVKHETFPVMILCFIHISDQGH